MRVALVGPELEENLALRYIHAALAEAGHEPRIYDFHAPDQLAPVAMKIAAFAPDAVGLSMMFTSRSREFVALAERLRELGCRAHITAGGHFASFHAAQLLTDCAALDSIIHGEGEEAMCELMDHLADPGAVTGVTYRDGDRIANTGRRRNLPDLDERAFPTRPDQFHTYMGLGIASLLAGRGCYADCNFCSINAWHRQSGGPRFRQRSVEKIAYEMAELYHCRNVRIFNFQDDQFFLPRERDNLERLGALQAELERHRVGKVALQVKARPDSVTDAVVGKLKEMGLFRVFLGVETNAVVGLVTLGRGIERQQNHRALDILREHHVHTCFNLLIFDPESQFSALHDNIEFLRHQHYFPLNFCRVEVYAGTAIERKLRDEGRLLGDYYGYTYTIANPRVQTAYEMFREVFTPRNFQVAGMNHQAMRVDYYYHLLAHFHPSRAVARTGRYVKSVVAELNRNNADLLDRICRFAEASGDAAAAVRARTDELSRERMAFDYAMRPRIENLLDQMHELAAAARRPARTSRAKVAGVAAAALLAGTLGCGPNKQDTHMAEMAPPDPTYPQQQTELTMDQVQQVQRIIQESYVPELLAFARRHGMLSTNQQVELIIDGDTGRVNEARMIGQTGDVDLDLVDMAQDWQLGGVVPEGVLATGVVTIAFPDDPDTHMAEMAPPDPTPPPPPPDNEYLNENQRRQLENEVNGAHQKELFAIGKKYGRTLKTVRVAVELGEKGVVDKADVILPEGVKNKRLERKLERTFAKWKFPAFPNGGKGTITVFLEAAPVKIEKEDTHMAEMAPPDPTYEP